MRPTSERAGRSAPPSNGAVIAAALLLGPLVGTILYLAASLVLTARSGYDAASAPDLFRVAPLAVALGYLIGSVPAVVGGLIYASLRGRLGDRASTAALAVVPLALPAAWVAGGSGGLVLAGGAIAFLVMSACLTWLLAATWHRRRA